MKSSLALSISLLTCFLTGCFGVAGGGNGIYYGGGGITLFLIILALGLAFGRGRR